MPADASADFEPVDVLAQERWLVAWALAGAGLLVTAAFCLGYLSAKLGFV
jgi:hypothetical protein